MIKLIASLLGGSTIAAWLLVALLGAGAVGGAYWWADHQGYRRASTEWSQKYTQRELDLERQRISELSRQAEANDQAKASEAARLAQLRSEVAELERQLKENANAAAQDPDRDRIGCNIDCVRRINPIGHPK